MGPVLIKKLKQKLENEKEALEKALQSHADKDKKLEGDWDTRFPKWDGEVESGSARLEQSADEVEEYTNLLPIEYNLELRLQDINLALKKIDLTLRGEVKKKENRYGVCEKCGKKILIARLKVCPEARLCMKCQIK